MLSPETRSRLIQADKSFDFYLGLLGLDQAPNSPEELPEEFFLPAGFIGPLRNARIESNTYGYERSGYLKWDSKSKMLKHKKMKIISDKLAHSPLILPFSETPIVTYHTHPNGTSLPSGQDMKVYGKNRRMGYVFITIGEKDITALLYAPNIRDDIDQNTELRNAFSTYADGLSASAARDHGLVLFKGQDTTSGVQLKKITPISFEQYHQALISEVG